MQVFAAAVCGISVLIYLSPRDARADEVQSVTVRVVDEQDQPVAGVEVGSTLYNTDPENETGQLELLLLGDERGPPAVTGENGTVAIDAKLLFFQEAPRARPIIAMTSDISRMGFIFVTRAEAGDSVEIKLHPACEVVVNTTCSRLVELGRDLRNSIVYVYAGDHALIEQLAITGPHTLHLPAGAYCLTVYGSETYSVQPEFRIEPDEQRKEIDVELPATRLAELIGHPAPELREIKAWRGGEPVTLAELRGKVVILDFWGYWCGPCVAHLPDLFELHDLYHDRGLEIIGVHDDSVADLAELESHLSDIREEYWNGRDTPFRVAIDGGGKRDIRGHHAPVNGATTAEYGISGWPMYVLIDRAGNVWGKIGPQRPEHRQLIEELLDDEGRAEAR